MKNLNFLINFAIPDLFPGAHLIKGATNQLSVPMKIKLAMLMAIVFSGCNAVSFAQGAAPTAVEQASQATDDSQASQALGDARLDRSPTRLSQWRKRKRRNPTETPVCN